MPALKVMIGIMDMAVDGSWVYEERPRTEYADSRCLRYTRQDLQQVGE